jgi:signal transduction histidine kinase
MNLIGVDLFPDSSIATEFELFFRSVPGRYLVLTPELTIRAASDAYLRATMTTRDQIVGRYVFDVFPVNPTDIGKQSQQGLLASFRQVLETGQSDALPVFRYDLAGPESNDLEERHWSVTNHPILDSQGKVRFIINHVEDVTEFVRLNRLHREEMRANEELKLQTQEIQTELFSRMRELDEANLSLRQANDDLETFASSVSHDLQAPLRHIRSFAQILLEDHMASLNEAGKEHLQTIIEGSAQMAALIEDLINYSRVSRQEIRVMPVRLQDVIATVVQRIPQGASVRRLRIEIPPNTPQVIANRTILLQVILNLVWNASKFVKAGNQPELAIAAEAVNESVRLWVRDRGIGIKPEHLDRIFKPFERLNSMDQYPGTGIGLAIVKRGIERMNGRVGVESQVGEGSSFWIELPAA